MLTSRVVSTSFAGGCLLLALFVGCGGSTEETGSGGGGAAGSGGSGGSAGTGGAAGQAGTGGTAGTGGAAGQAGTGGTGGTAGTGGAAVQPGDCDDNDPLKACPDDGSACTAIVPGGFQVCTLLPEEATTCAGSGYDECCDSSECTTGACFHNSVMPGYGCGGAPPPDMNVCASDQCDDDTDCGQGIGQICTPVGLEGSPIRFCMTAVCTKSADCTAEAGGECAPVRDPCCGRWAGLYCVYPTNGCRSQADCGQGLNCVIDGSAGICTDAPIACPP